MRAATFTLSIILAAARLCAGLTWETTTLELEAGPLDEKVEGKFRFTNTGTSDITITQSHASCGCTVPTLDKQTFAPGESGEMRVVYSVPEGAVGKQEKTITVLTSETPEQSYLLTLSVNVPGLWDVHPRFVRWDRDEEATGKVMTIRALHPEVAKPVSVESRDARFSVELKPSPDDPAVFLVTVRPSSTADAMFTSVIVETSAPATAAAAESAEKKRVVQLFAVVR